MFKLDLRKEREALYSARRGECAGDDGDNDDDAQRCCPVGDRFDQKFSGETTCHGLAHISDAGNFIRRVFWILICVTSCCLLVQQVFERIQYFLEFELKTSLRVEGVKNLTLPAITICNINMFFNTLDSVDKNMLRLGHQAAQKAYNSTFNETFFDYMKQKEAILKLSGGNDDITKQTMSQWVNGTSWQLVPEDVYQCRMYDRNCTGADFKEVLTEQGKCYTINKDGRMIQRIEGVAGGISFYVNINQDGYTKWTMENEEQYEAGLIVTVHPFHMPPKVRSDGISVSPGFRARVALKQTITKTINKFPWNECVPEDSPYLNFPEYTTPACVSVCMAEKINALCGCKPYYLPGGFRECTVVEQGYCVKWFEIWDEVAREECLERCIEGCITEEFDTFVSYSKLPSAVATDAFRDLNNSRLDNETGEIAKNVVGISIFFKEINFLVVQTSEAVTVGGLLGDLGGQLGLFAGISVMTAFEFLEYPIRRLYYCWKHRKDSKKGRRRASSPSTLSRHSSCCELQRLKLRNLLRSRSARTDFMDEAAGAGAITALDSGGGGVGTGTGIGIGGGNGFVVAAPTKTPTRFGAVTPQCECIGVRLAADGERRRQRHDDDSAIVDRAFARLERDALAHPTTHYR